MAREPRRLRERKKAQTRRSIIDTTVDVIRERGYEKATVDEVVRRVEISVPTFYSYFNSKDAVLRAVAGEILEEWADRGETESESWQDGSTEERLRHLYNTLADWMMGDTELWQAIVLSDALDPIRLPEQQEADIRFRRVYESVIAEGQERGEITREFPSEQLAGVLDTLWWIVCRAWSSGYPTVPFGSLHPGLERALAIFLHGALPRSDGEVTRES